jgi:hypothetical protein
MSTTTRNKFKSILRTICFLLIGVLAASTGALRANAQEKRPGSPGKVRNPEATQLGPRNQGGGYFCQQQLKDLSITQRTTRRYEFRFHTVCSTPVTIEFFKKPPVSLNPPRFEKPQYGKDEPLVPVITTGLIGDRTDHLLYANLAGIDAVWDYYLITVQDASGNKFYRTGSLSLESLRPIRITR